MQIAELVIKNFGKFTEKKIRLSDGIQLFYGENESGKSMILLHGMNRGKIQIIIREA